jgi:hypothetical protein
MSATVNADSARWRASHPRAFPTARSRAIRIAAIAAFAAWFLWALWLFDITPARLWRGIVGDTGCSRSSR